MSDIEYECKKCGHIPSQKELQQGRCPICHPRPEPIQVKMEAPGMDVDSRPLGFQMNDIKEMREASGNVKIRSQLVSFLYELMRDHLTPGEVEGLVQRSQVSEVTYTNGWLARYAEHIASRLKD